MYMKLVVCLLLGTATGAPGSIVVGPSPRPEDTIVESNSIVVPAPWHALRNAAPWRATFSAHNGRPGQRPAVGAAPRETFVVNGGVPVMPILMDIRDIDGDGNYRFNYETGDGILRQEQGAPVGPNGAVTSRGGWSFTFPDGTPAFFTFVADEGGYRVESDLLPTPHPLPAHALAQIEKARQEDAAAGAAGGGEDSSSSYRDSSSTEINGYTFIR